MVIIFWISINSLKFSLNLGKALFGNTNFGNGDDLFGGADAVLRFAFVVFEFGRESDFGGDNEAIGAGGGAQILNFKTFYKNFETLYKNFEILIKILLYI